VVWAVPAVFASIIFAIMCYAPPSPRWLVLRGRKPEAAAAMRWLLPGMSDAAIAASISDIEQTLDALDAPDTPLDRPPPYEGPCSACDPCSRSEAHEWTLLCESRRPLVAGLGLVIMQQLTGQPTVLYYAQAIFMEAGLSVAQSKSSDLIVAVAKLVATLAAVTVVDRLGRRPLLLFGTGLMFAALVVLTTGFAVGGGEITTGAWTWAVVVALMAYVAGYQVGFGPCTWVIIGEVFPLRSRTRALGSAVIVNFALNLVVILTDAQLEEAFGQATLFAFFGAMCVVAIVFVCALIPETKGKSLEEIDALIRADGACVSSEDEGANQLRLELERVDGVSRALDGGPPTLDVDKRAVDDRPSAEA